MREFYINPNEIAILKSLTTGETNYNEPNKEGKQARGSERDRLLRAYRKSGNMKIRDDLIESLMPLVYHWAVKFSKRHCHISPPELIGEGVEGIILAIEKADLRRKNFEIYAGIYIRESIKHSVFFRSVFNENYKHRMDVPSIVSIDEVISLMDELRSDPRLEERKVSLLKALGALDPRIREILELSLGLIGETLSQRQIANRIGISPTHVHRLYHRGIAELKKMLVN